MGLVVQPYIEFMYPNTDDTGDYWPSQAGLDLYGQGRPAFNGRTVELQLNHNFPPLHFDVAALKRGETALHMLLTDMPDHRSPLQQAAQSLVCPANAVVFAERLSGRPMEVEFASQYVLQARPVTGFKEEPTVEFPVDRPHLAEARTIHAGDQILPILQAHDFARNTNKTGYIIIETDTQSSLIPYRVYPKNGAVVLLMPTSHGHVQAICREKGLMCFMPPRDGSWLELDSALKTEDGTYRDWLRFVSDGMDGRIYQADEIQDSKNR